MTVFENILYECKRRLKEESLARIIQCIDRLNEEQLWYSPNKNTNSVGILVLHLCGNIQQYICATLGNEKDERDREAEFNPKTKPSKTELKTRINKTISEAITHIEALSTKNLTHPIPVQCFEESPISILIHVIEHTSYHVGQISWITKSLLNTDLQYYGDLPLDNTR